MKEKFRFLILDFRPFSAFRTKAEILSLAHFSYATSTKFGTHGPFCVFDISEGKANQSISLIFADVSQQQEGRTTFVKGLKRAPKGHPN